MKKSLLTFFYLLRHFLRSTHFSAVLSEEQNSKYKVNILRVKWKSTTRVGLYSVAKLAPVFAQLIQTLDWDQNSGVRLVFGLSEKTQRKTNRNSEVTH